MATFTKKTGVGAPTLRGVKFALTIITASSPIPIDQFLSRNAEWGDRRRFLDLCDQVNQAWDQTRGVPLFEYLGPELEPGHRIRKYFRRVDQDDVLMMAQNVAALPALMQFVRTLQGTPFQEALTSLYDFLERKVSKSAKKPLVRIDPKYHLVTKGIKEYGGHQEVLDEINTALLYEKIVTVTRKDKQLDLEPLSLLMYNGGLYLLAYVNPRKPRAKPYTYKIESFMKARCDRSRGFEYPVGFRPADFFRETFGLFNNGDSLVEVKVEVLADEIIEYITERRWTAHQSYDPGSRIFTMRVRDVTEIGSWILGFGPKVRVLKPDSLKAAIEEAIKGMQAIYRRGA